MHELSVALSIVDIAAAEAQRQGDAHVAVVHLKLGPLAGVVKEALLSAYELACEHSPLAGSRLLIQDVPIVVYCPSCRAERSVVSIQQICCAECQTPTPQIVSGRELEVVAMEIEQ